MKRISVRAIIINKNTIALMHRINNRDYYTLPGGGIEKTETLEYCAQREIKEEFGIDIEIIKQVYEYERENSLEYIFLCNWEKGEFGTGTGEEILNPYPEKGRYIPELIEIGNLKNINLLPKIVKEQIIKDLDKYGKEFANTILKLKE